MSILSSLADILVGGGATGLATGIGTMAFKIFELKENNKHEQERWKYTVDMTRENAKHETMLADKELLIKKQQGADSQRLAAIEAEGKLAELQNVSQWVNNVRSLHRLVLSYLLIGGAFWMHWIERGQAIAGIESSEAQILLTIFVTNSAASAVGFWFGDRVVCGTPHKGKSR